MFEHLVFDPNHVQTFRDCRQDLAYRVKVMVRTLLREAEACVWSEKALLLCVKALQWLHANAHQFMGQVLEREFETLRQDVHKTAQPLRVHLHGLEETLWSRVSRTCINWAQPCSLDTPEELWFIVQSLCDFALQQQHFAAHALYAMLCADWLLCNPNFLATSATLTAALRDAMQQNHILADMYARRLANLGLPGCGQ